MTDHPQVPVGGPAHVAEPFSIAVEPRSDAVLIAPTGELDLATVGQLERELGQLIDAGVARLVIDLRGLEYMDSTGLHALLTAHALAQKNNCELTIIPGPRQVQRILEVTGMVDHLPFATANGRAPTP